MGFYLWLVNVWLMLYLSFLVLSLYVVVFVTAGCLADPLLVIPGSQLVCGCVCHCWMTG